MANFEFLLISEMLDRFSRIWIDDFIFDWYSLHNDSGT